MSSWLIRGKDSSDFEFQKHLKPERDRQKPLSPTEIEGPTSAQDQKKIGPESEDLVSRIWRRRPSSSSLFLPYLDGRLGEHEMKAHMFLSQI